MKKALQIGLVALSTVSTFAMAEQLTTTPEKVKAALGPQTAQAIVKDNLVTVISPRTGISYTFNNENKPIVLQTQAIVAANSANAERIVAANPAVSAESQQKAKQALLEAAK
ncbi:hypothetical protein [Acinetobacter sp. B51(2017)]|uniref:hypothetical protein n=1 Tax=Acinetobacter sp. B51(2017) TaxID=2060938 RepID=UPI000F07F8F4|nr:hypothetical protein [Acinetobacter sp. B51(2017)]